MKEHYPGIRAAMKETNADIQSKEIVTSVASSWKALAEGEREAWKDRAKAMTETEEVVPDDALAEAHIEAEDMEGESV